MIDALIRWVVCGGGILKIIYFEEVVLRGGALFSFLEFVSFFFCTAGLFTKKKKWRKRLILWRRRRRTEEEKDNRERKRTNIRDYRRR